jgi:hypothetical protein
MSSTLSSQGEFVLSRWLYCQNAPSVGGLIHPRYLIAYITWDHIPCLLLETNPCFLLGLAFWVETLHHGAKKR